MLGCNMSKETSYEIKKCSSCREQFILPSEEFQRTLQAERFGEPWRNFLDSLRKEGKHFKISLRDTTTCPYCGKQWK